MDHFKNLKKLYNQHFLKKEDYLNQKENLKEILIQSPVKIFQARQKSSNENNKPIKKKKIFYKQESYSTEQRLSIESNEQSKQGQQLAKENTYNNNFINGQSILSKSVVKLSQPIRYLHQNPQFIRYQSQSRPQVLLTNCQPIRILKKFVLNNSVNTNKTKQNNNSLQTKINKIEALLTPKQLSNLIVSLRTKNSRAKKW